MLVVHGAWVDGRLGLWAEDTARPRGPAPRGPASAGRADPAAPQAGPPGREAPPAHPFAAAAPVLAAALAEGAAPSEGAAEQAELPLLLPASARGPLPSPESGRAVPAAAGAAISPWRVPALLLRPAAALPLLGSVPLHDVPPVLDAGDEPVWAPGLSLRYFAVVGEHARALVRRGRILPQLAWAGDVPEARWRPVLTGADAAALRDLAAAMPPVCRAVRGERPSARVLREALDALVDGAARLAMPDRLIAGNRPGLRSALTDRWLHALTAEDPSLPSARPAEAAALDEALRAWLAAGHELDGPVRACFRLTEPADDGGPDGDPDRAPWQVEFGLSPAGEPGRMLPAARILAGERAPWLPERPMELLRTELERAVRLHPGLHTALRSAEPTGMAVETAWAFSFLRGGAPALRAAGYGVLLPAWAGRTGLGLRMTARATGAEGRTGRGADRGTGRTTGLDDPVAVRFDVVVGDHVLSEEELAGLAGRRIPLARIAGRWVELDDAQLKAALRAAGRRGGEATVGGVIREVVEGGDGELPLVGVEADGPLGDLLSGEADRRLTPVATPAAFRGTLRPYQERGLSWLSFLSGLGLGGVLADDMGLGKTAQTLSLLLGERAGGRAVPPTLLVCPMSLVGNWQKEAARFAPSLRVYVHHGGARHREEAELAAAVREADLVVTTYGTALRDAGALARLEWERVVCDEAQAIKNSTALQSRAVRSIPARTRLALTGTPVENRLSELWSIMEFCNPGLLGSAKRFRKRYQEPIETRGDEDASRALRRATGPFVLRRLKTDRSIISDLPEKLEMKVWCTLTSEQAELYRAVLNDMLGRIDRTEGVERRGNVLATMTRLKQICNHPAHLLGDGSPLAGRSGKLARLEEIAAEVVAEGDRALVFTQYAAFGSLLQPYLAARLEVPVLWLHGGLPKARRDELVERFQSAEGPMLFLLSLKAAGTGLNLTAASHVVHVDRWWNPAVEDQATDRAFRIGQKRNVQVRKFVCVDTLEERIDEMIERKKALAETVVGTGEDWIADLSTERLRELFALGPGAVS
ncbi:DEAD/DEAH box helicase [Planomonospora alba]|uniref:DEAD/DEAH box helicase n=1 Tax=Planomonospora alba TaxID=161354 RepID=A0ABP6MXI8_9ACTN